MSRIITPFFSCLTRQDVYFSLCQSVLCNSRIQFVDWENVSGKTKLLDPVFCMELQTFGILDCFYLGCCMVVW